MLYFDEDCFVPVNANRKPRKPQQGNQKAAQASVYPNPATTLLTVNCTSADSKPVQLVIRDIAGRIVLTQQLNPAANLSTVKLKLSHRELIRCLSMQEIQSCLINW